MTTWQRITRFIRMRLRPDGSRDDRRDLVAERERRERELRISTHDIGVGSGGV